MTILEERGNEVEQGGFSLVFQGPETVLTIWRILKKHKTMTSEMGQRSYAQKALNIFIGLELRAFEHAKYHIFIQTVAPGA